MNRRSYRAAKGAHGSGYAVSGRGLPLAAVYRLAASRYFDRMGRIVMSPLDGTGPLRLIRLADLES